MTEINIPKLADRLTRALDISRELVDLVVSVNASGSALPIPPKLRAALFEIRGLVFSTLAFLSGYREQIVSSRRALAALGTESSGEFAGVVRVAAELERRVTPPLAQIWKNIQSFTKGLQRRGPKL